MSEATITFETELLSDLRRLPPDKMREVRDFVEYLKDKYAVKPQQESPNPPRGSAEAILRHAGTWKMEPGELDAILRDIDHFRHIEED